MTRTDTKRSGVITGARIVLALEREQCEPTVTAIANFLDVSTNSARKAILRLCGAEVLYVKGVYPRPGTPPTAFYGVVSPQRKRAAKAAKGPKAPKAPKAAKGPKAPKLAAAATE